MRYPYLSTLPRKEKLFHSNTTLSCLSPGVQRHFTPSHCQFWSCQCGTHQSAPESLQKTPIVSRLHMCALKPQPKVLIWLGPHNSRQRAPPLQTTAHECPPLSALGACSHTIASLFLSPQWSL